MNALKNASAASQRSYLAAKAAVTQVSDTLLARGPGGVVTHRPDLARAQEQLCHFRGWVYASIRPIAQRIAGQPIHVGRLKSAHRLGTKQADIEPLESHQLVGLFADPNDLMVAWSLMYVTVASLELTGRSLWWLPGKKQILPIPTSWIKELKGATKFTAFRVQPPYSGESFDLPAAECVYVAYPDPSDPQGALSPLQAVAGAVDADESITLSQSAMFRRGIHPSHVVLVGKNPHPDLPGGQRPHLTAAQQRQIIGAIQKRYTGVVNHGEPLILDALIEDVRKLSNTPAEMDWLNSGKMTKERIMQGFGTNPIIAGQVEGSNRASSTVADEHFCNYVLNPKIELLSQSLTEWLRWVFNDETLVVWIEPCVVHDAEERRRWAELLSRHSAITGDELRQLSPFDLGVGSFSEPVSGGGRDPEAGQLQEAMKELDEALTALKSTEPHAVARGIIERSKVPLLNGNRCG